MKIYEAWDELKSRLQQLVDAAYAHDKPFTAERYKAILSLIDELEMEYE